MKSDIEWCISTTNNVIDKWSSRVDSNIKITKDDVRQVLLGYLRKRVCGSRANQEFKELKKRILINTDENMHISSITLNVIDIYKYSSNRIIDNRMIIIESIMKLIDFKSLIGLDKSEIEYNPIVNIHKEPNSIKNMNFESIINIKF